MWAVERYLGHWDGYSRPQQPNNYYLLSEAAGSLPDAALGHRSDLGRPTSLRRRRRRPVRSSAWRTTSCAAMYRRSLREAAIRDRRRPPSTPSPRRPPALLAALGGTRTGIAEPAARVRPLTRSPPAVARAPATSSRARPRRTRRLRRASRPKPPARRHRSRASQPEHDRRRRRRPATVATATVSRRRREPVPGDEVDFTLVRPGCPGRHAGRPPERHLHASRSPLRPRSGRATITATDSSVGPGALTRPRMLTQTRGPAAADRASSCSPTRSLADGSSTTTATADDHRRPGRTRLAGGRGDRSPRSTAPMHVGRSRPRRRHLLGRDHRHRPWSGRRRVTVRLTSRSTPARRRRPRP